MGGLASGEKSKWNGEVTEETRYRKGMVLNTYKYMQ